MSIAKKIVEYVKYQREKRGYSINQFARMIGFDPSFVLRLERGEYDDLRISTITKIAGILKMSLRDFLVKCQLIKEEKISMPSA